MFPDISSNCLVCPLETNNETESETGTTLKFQKLNEPGEPIRNIFIPELSGDPESEISEFSDLDLDDQSETESCKDACTQTAEFDYIFSNKNCEEKPFDEHYFANDDAKVRFYTGLPSFEILKKTFSFVAPHVETVFASKQVPRICSCFDKAQTKCSTSRSCISI